VDEVVGERVVVVDHQDPHDTQARRCSRTTG
jgi:hypothetical protein